MYNFLKNTMANLKQYFNTKNIHGSTLFLCLKERTTNSNNSLNVKIGLKLYLHKTRLRYSI